MEVPTPDVLVTALLLTIEPADIGLPVHFHSGPVVGYIIEGEFLFQVSRQSICDPKRSKKSIFVSIISSLICAVNIVSEGIH